MGGSPSETRPTTDDRLRGLLADVEELAEVLTQFEEISEAEQDVWLYGWPNRMNILEHEVAPAYRRGGMSAEQGRRYEELKARLRELAPEIERTLELRVPPSVLEE